MQLDESRLRRLVLPIIVGLHGGLMILLPVMGLKPWFEFFPFILLIFNLAVAGRAWQRLDDPRLSLALIIVTAGHSLAGHALAPTALTSAAMYISNLLTVYVGIKLYRHGSRQQLLLFLASFVALFYLFIFHLENAEPLFLMSLLGLAGTCRSNKLLSYFWVVILAFTIGQPFAWASLIIGILVLASLYSARTTVPSGLLFWFLGLGLLLLLSVLLPVILMITGESLYNLFNVLGDEAVLRAIRLTMVTATISSFFLFFGFLPLAYALARINFKTKPLLLSLIDMPIIIPQSVAGLALLKVFGKQQIIGGFLYSALGLRFDGEIAGIILAQVFVAMPFFMRSAIAALEAVPERLELAGRCLGAGSFDVFRRITLPLAGRGLFLAIVLAWARAAGEFGAVFFIANFPATAPIEVYRRFMSLGLDETAPLVSVLLIFSLAMFFFLQWLSRTLPGIRVSRSLW